MQPCYILLKDFVLSAICLVVYVYTICMLTPLGVNISLCVQVCVYRMRMAPHSDGPLVGKKKRERERVGVWEDG